MTKRLLVNESTKAIHDASKRAMRIAGSTVIVQDGWIVRRYADDSIKRIKKLDSTIRNQTITLD